LKRKGGSGSSTLAANLGAEWHARGRTVRVLDCDPQRSFTVWAGLGEGGALQSIVEPVEAQQGGEFRAVLERAAERHERVVVAEAAIRGQAVREIEPGDDSAREFSALTDAIDALLEGRARA
jgi:chromosome partitioning protein